jgi:hypothetical protein
LRDQPHSGINEQTNNNLNRSESPLRNRYSL